MTQSERFAIIERLLQARRGVSFDDLRQRLGVSRATLFRDLRDLRDRMGVPIVHNRDTGLYRIDPEAERFELPGVWFSASEIHALLTMQKLLAAIDTGGILAEHVEPLQQRLHRMLESTADSADEIARRIRIVSIAARRYAPNHFQEIATALMGRRRLRIRYAARSSGIASEREISPQRLTHYRDNWYLDAWCHMRDELRSFSVDAIEATSMLAITAADIADEILDRQLASGYGIFAGDRIRWAELRFSEKRARWVAGEQWHPDQQGAYLEDGRYQLRVPYSNDPELIMDILKYGPDCEVVGPTELRERVTGFLREAVAQYR